VPPPALLVRLLHREVHRLVLETLAVVLGHARRLQRRQVLLELQGQRCMPRKVSSKPVDNENNDSAPSP
jgi:hypothetical protein